MVWFSFLSVFHVLSYGKGRLCPPQHMCGGQGTVKESVLPFHYMGSRACGPLPAEPSQQTLSLSSLSLALLCHCCLVHTFMEGTLGCMCDSLPNKYCSGLARWKEVCQQLIFCRGFATAMNVRTMPRPLKTSWCWVYGHTGRVTITAS